MDSFALRKGYLDVVDADGRCAIAYRTELAWGPLAFRWEGLSLFEPGHQPAHRSALKAIPRRRGQASAWPPGTWPGANGKVGDIGGERDRPSQLGVRVTCEPWCAPFAARLLETPAGSLDWSCDAGADVVLQTDDGIAVRGAGYAERLELNMPPWKLPIDELRWGRWHAAASRRSVVWIDWRGERPLTLVLDGGAARDGANVRDQAIEWGDQSLHLGPTEVLYSRRLAEIVGVSGPLLNRLPKSWHALEDRKNLSRGVLGSDSGWAIHERVRFP